MLLLKPKVLEDLLQTNKTWITKDLKISQNKKRKYFNQEVLHTRSDIKDYYENKKF